MKHEKGDMGSELEWWAIDRSTMRWEAVQVYDYWLPEFESYRIKASRDFEF